jgi:transcription elongation factor Elf1
MGKSRVTRMRSAHHVDCPACGHEINADRTDVGAHDGIEVEVDCDRCGAVIQTVGIVMVVAALDRATAVHAAERTRGEATDPAGVRALLSAAALPSPQ